MSRIERGHAQDVKDVEAMVRCGLVDSPKLITLFREIEPFLYKYPAIDPDSFAEAVQLIAQK